MMSKRWDQEEPEKQVLVMIIDKYELVSILLKHLTCYAKVHNPSAETQSKVSSPPA
jgi:hypothetical protein